MPLLVVTIIKHIPPPHGPWGPEDLTKESPTSATAPRFNFPPEAHPCFQTPSHLPSTAYPDPICRAELPAQRPPPGLPAARSIARPALPNPR